MYMYIWNAYTLDMYFISSVFGYRFQVLEDLDPGQEYLLWEVMYWTYMYTTWVSSLNAVHVHVHHIVFVLYTLYMLHTC